MSDFKVLAILTTNRVKDECDCDSCKEQKELDELNKELEEWLKDEN